MSPRSGALVALTLRRQELEYMSTVPPAVAARFISAFGRKTLCATSLLDEPYAAIPEWAKIAQASSLC
jgi:hypothetical protein